MAHQVLLNRRNRLAKEASGASEAGVAWRELDTAAEAAAEVEAGRRLGEHAAYEAADFALEAEF